MHLRIGSRGSRLALWQSNHIAAHLRALGHTAEIIIIRTTGDRLQDPAFAASVLGPDGKIPANIDGKGIFIKEIEEALEGGSIDLAVHSLKDLPTQLDARFTLAAIPERADPRDVLLVPEWLQIHTLPSNARIGTTSPRRIAQLRSHNPEFQFVAIRGNIDTRIRKLGRGDCDALVLAAAGLDRLGSRLLKPVDLDPLHPEFGRKPHIECITHPDHDHLADHFDGDSHRHGEDLPGQADWIRQRFDPEMMCPAPGQGALAIETRANDAATIAAIKPLDNAHTRYAVEAERWLLHALGGGCSLPVGALCTEVDGVAKLQSTVVSPDGEAMATVTLFATAGESAESLGTRAANDLIAQGARELLAGDFAMADAE
ncbi:hydroxymethylbilane synthase [Terriglobus roseus]|uniref:Porphobilinogen deaminase n=1 Tax=Terriglobus roseus TaxID=392734 RepID=A0A1H4J993_9BACT|nr:hydroxymethylbilane synthase [Terriglobus roseus]SEB42645.1 hydroxymethylbilane synthase [Terriglobus roseus]